MERIGKEEVRRRTGIERDLPSIADQRVLRWFGHVERMDEYRMARREIRYLTLTSAITSLLWRK